MTFNLDFQQRLNNNSHLNNKLACSKDLRSLEAHRTSFSAALEYSFVLKWIKFTRGRLT